MRVSLDHWHVRPIAKHKSRLPFLLGSRVFFVFYWHSVKILRKNGKVAEPVRGGRPGPGGARLLAGAGAACAGPAVTCCMAPAGPALARAPEIRAGPRVSGPRLGSARPSPGRACRGLSRELYKVKERERRWIQLGFCKHVSWHLVCGKYIIPKLCFLRRIKNLTFMGKGRDNFNYVMKWFLIVLVSYWCFHLNSCRCRIVIMCFTSRSNKNHFFQICYKSLRLVVVVNALDCGRAGRMERAKCGLPRLPVLGPDTPTNAIHSSK